MDYAYARQRGPPLPSDDRDRDRRPPPHAAAAAARERDWHERGGQDRRPLQSHRPSLDDDRYYSRRPHPDEPGPSSTATGGGGSGFEGRSIEDDEGYRGGRFDRDNYYDSERPRDFGRQRERPYSRLEGGAGGPSAYQQPRRGSGFYQRRRSSSPLPSIPPSGPSSAAASSSSNRPPVNSPPKRPWGQANAGTRPFPPSTSSTSTPLAGDRDGPYRGTPRDASWSDRRANGAVASSSSSSSAHPLPNERFSRPEAPASASKAQRDGRGRLPIDEDRKPFDNGYSRHPLKANGYASTLPAAETRQVMLTARSPSSDNTNANSNINGWKGSHHDDKGKGPAYDYDDRRPVPHRNNQNNPPPPSSSLTSINGSSHRARSPDSIRSRDRRSYSPDDFPLKSPASSTASQSRYSDRDRYVDFDRERERERERDQQRSFNQSRLSAPPLASSHPPFNRSNSAGQPAPLRREIDFPPDRPPEGLEARVVALSASLNQGIAPRLSNGNGANVKAWPARRRSLSTSPPRRDSDQPPPSDKLDYSPPRSLAERLGPLASAASSTAARTTGSAGDLSARIEPIVFRPKTPPPKSSTTATRQSAPSSSHRQPTTTSSAQPPPQSLRSFTPPLPSPASQRAAVQQRLDSSAPPPSAIKTGSPSPRLASSPSEAAQSSPRPSTSDEHAGSEITQARTSPDVSKEEDDTVMQEGEASGEPEAVEQELESGEIKAPKELSSVLQAEATSPVDRMPRAPIPLRSTENALPTITDSDADNYPTKAQSPLPEPLLETATVLAEMEADIAEGTKPELQAEDTSVEVNEIVSGLETGDIQMQADSSILEHEAETTIVELKLEEVTDMATSTAVAGMSMEVDPKDFTPPHSPVAAQIMPETMVEEPDDGEETDEEADPEAKEFEKTLTSFIEDNVYESEEEDSQDLTAILNENKFKAPISLPLAVEMPIEEEDLFEIKPIMLMNYDLLEGWLRETMASRDKRRGEKIYRLREQYKDIDTEWRAHCNRLEKIRERQKRKQNIPINPPTPSVDSAGISFAPTTPNLLAPSGRSNRRSAASSIGYGDAVRSEAEFLEILASLEDADMRDPNLRAMRTTATVPDQVIDESEYTATQQFDDNNGLVKDPFEHYSINKHPDNWTEEEIAIFCRRYALYPKQFGKIAAAIPDKSTTQCVLFYYRSKKKIDFRALVDRRNRDGRRKRSKGDKNSANGKGPSLLNNIQRARGEDPEEEEDEEPQTPGSAMAQESTVISTAKALTQQINGVPDSLGRPETVKRPLTGRSASNKKAARFLSPPADRSPVDEGAPPPSDGALAAAEALGFLSAIPNGEGSDSSRPSSAKQKKRKPSMTESVLNTSFGEDGVSRSINPAKRSRPHSSSYWSVADKNEFIRLLTLHGKNWSAISEGIQSKTAVQCKNFFQNNVKKMNLSEIASRVEGDFANTSGEMGAESPMDKSEMPSVFGEPGNSSTGVHEPHSGYFIPSHRANGQDGPESKSSVRSGGMHLRNLLDDAPDAEGGANPRIAAANAQTAPDDDSATEDEAEPARYAQDLGDARGALRQARTDNIYQRHANRSVKEETMAIDPALQDIMPVDVAHFQPHARSSSYGSRADYNAREQYSPPYRASIPVERGYAVPARQQYNGAPNGHYESIPPYAGRWQPYEGRQIYLDRSNGPGPGYFGRSRYEEPPPASYYHHERVPYADTPIHEKGGHQVAYAPRPQHSPYYEGHAGTPPPQPPASSLRHQSDARNGDAGSPYYDHYNLPRAT